MDSTVKRQRERMNQTQEGGQDRCVVSCKLRRNTFLPGEQIRGTVKFDVSSKGQSYVDIEQATVQAHGYVKVDPRWISLPTSLRSLFKQETTVGNDGDDNQGGRIPRYSGLDDNSSACVFASELVVLLEKEQVDQGEPASFSFSLVLPQKLTPTFRGVGVRYAYAVTVRIKRALPPPPATGLLGLVRRRPPPSTSGGVSITDMHVAFTVLSEGLAPLASVGAGLVGQVDGPLAMATSANAVERVGTSWSKAGWDSVAFAELEVERLSREAFNLEAERARVGGLVSGTRAVTWNMQGRMLDDGTGSIATSALLGEGPGESGDDDDLPSPLPPPMVFSIRSGEYRIGSFVLHKAEFCAGDIILGNFDFSSATIRCLQVCACLEISEENAFIGDSDSSTPGRRKSSGGGRNPLHKRVVDSFKELTPCVDQSSVALSLPMDAPVSFSTGLVTVSWRLRFEFTMAPPESRWAIGGYPPSKASVLRWAVPIKVVPPRRILVARGGAGSDREMSFNAMDSTGRTVLC